MVCLTALQSAAERRWRRSHWQKGMNRHRSKKSKSPTIPQSPNPLKMRVLLCVSSQVLGWFSASSWWLEGSSILLLCLADRIHCWCDSVHKPWLFLAHELQLVATNQLFSTGHKCFTCFTLYPFAKLTIEYSFCAIFGNTKELRLPTRYRQIEITPLLSIT